MNNSNMCNLLSSPNSLQYISNTNIYFANLHIFQKLVIPPTLRPKGTRKPSKLHSSPKCWHGISNMNKYIQLTYTPQIVGSIYPIQICIFINVHFQTVCPKRIQNPSELHSSLNCWQHISNTTIYFHKCTLPNPVPEGHTKTLQLTFIPQLLA